MVELQKHGVERAGGEGRKARAQYLAGDGELGSDFRGLARSRAAGQGFADARAVDVRKMEASVEVSLDARALRCGKAFIEQGVEARGARGAKGCACDLVAALHLLFGKAQASKPLAQKIQGGWGMD